MSGPILPECPKMAREHENAAVPDQLSTHPATDKQSDADRAAARDGAARAVPGARGAFALCSSAAKDVNWPDLHGFLRPMPSCCKLRRKAPAYIFQALESVVLDLPPCRLKPCTGISITGTPALLAVAMSS